jgi:hypothetical protein
MVKRKLSILILLFVFLFNCEELEELLTHVSGKVYANNCKVVLAVKGESELLGYLDDIDGIDEISLRDAEIFRGYDVSIGNDSLYNVTMLSFGETYLVAIVDDGLDTNELDSLDHIGFHGESDTLLNVADTSITYTIPKKMDIEEGVDEENIDIQNFLEFRWFIRLYETIN